ncbi:hypothetical protein GCM10023351_01740 [Microbacterium gilvum]|uniref:Uncharacterized protein n=1 Tax=Microbacterium gilvum TaxID=1336204 RepID=A0ABP8ZQ15_9MICO
MTRKGRAGTSRRFASLRSLDDPGQGRESERREEEATSIRLAPALNDSTERASASNRKRATLDRGGGAPHSAEKRRGRDADPERRPAEHAADTRNPTRRVEGFDPDV